MNRPAAKQLRAGKWLGQLVCACGWLAAGGLFGNLVHAAEPLPDNVFARASVLPADLQRVVVLPLAADGPDADLPAGCEALQPVIFDELIRMEKFEVVSARPENLRAGTGRAAWTGTEPLPAAFFDSLQREYGCDAVLFCELTVYHAYAPLAIGWRLKLADVRTHQIIWSADEVFDSHRSAFNWDITEFFEARDSLATKAETRWRLLNSPLQFGRLTVAEILNTLPVRQNTPKVVSPMADRKPVNEKTKSLGRPRYIYGSRF
jgi:hypothetical protein